MVLLFVVCGWREEDRGGSVPTYDLVHSIYGFLVTRAKKVGNIVNPAVRSKGTKRTLYSAHPSNELRTKVERHDSSRRAQPQSLLKNWQSWPPIAVKLLKAHFSYSLCTKTIFQSPNVKKWTSPSSNPKNDAPRVNPVVAKNTQQPTWAADASSSSFAFSCHDEASVMQNLWHDCNLHMVPSWEPTIEVAFGVFGSLVLT